MNIRRFNLIFLPVFVFLLLASVAFVASAIVVRHDVPDAAYLGRQSDYPALFSLYRTKAGHNECIATLISPRFAITAAHCAQEKSLLTAAEPGAAGFEVTVAGLKERIDAVIHHPGSGTGRPPDIALLRFAKAVTHVAPVPLYRVGDEVGRIIVMPGWGGTGTGATGLDVEDGQFRIAENRVDRMENQRLYWRFDAPSTGQALTLEGISGPGDSGGPALLQTPDGWHIAGVSSGQDTMGGPEGLYGVEESFVRISEFVEWIDGHLHAGPTSVMKRN